MPGRKEIIKETDPALTKDGRPIEEHLEQEERNDLDETRRQEIGIKARTKKHFRPRERFEDDPTKVSKRVRRLSDWEIRKVYGVKMKPHKTLTQDVLYLLFNTGDTAIDSNAVAKELERKLPDVSSVLSTIWKKLKDTGLLNREKIGMAYHYKMAPAGIEMGLDSMIQKYFPGPGGSKRKQTPDLPVAPDDAYTRLLKITDDLTNEFHSLLERIKMIETDGLGDQVEQLEKKFMYLDQVLSDPEYRAAGGEFNINVRFLFGRA